MYQFVFFIFLHIASIATMFDHKNDVKEEEGNHDDIDREL